MTSYCVSELVDIVSTTLLIISINAALKDTIHKCTKNVLPRVLPRWIKSNVQFNQITFYSVSDNLTTMLQWWYPSTTKIQECRRGWLQEDYQEERIHLRSYKSYRNNIQERGKKILQVFIRHNNSYENKNWGVNNMTKHIGQDSNKQAVLEDKMDQEFALLVAIAIPRMLVCHLLTMIILYSSNNGINWWRKPLHSALSSD